MEQANNTILILDFGSQYSQLIARRIRDLHIYSSMTSYRVTAEEVSGIRPAGLILSGGPASVYGENAPLCDPAIFDLGIPILGICYGLQLMVHQRGGRVEAGSKREFGHASLNIKGDSPLFGGLPTVLKVWMSHGDKVQLLPAGMEVIGATDNAEYAAVADEKRRHYGLQFHPEVVHTQGGKDILRNFCVSTCGCKQNWTMKSFVERSITEIREKVGDGKVILGLSGGIDSSVAAALLHRAIGDQLICVFVDNGLLRTGEVKAVMRFFEDTFSLNLQHESVATRFLDKLQGVTDPETKRRIIGHEFVAVFEEVADRFDDVRFLGQGTTYPDVIESVPIDGNPSALIKSHHNVGGLPEAMGLDLVEPLWNLFKDEVRAVGTELGLPREMIMRQPFPGPGLAIRIIGEITSERLDVLRKADTIVLEEMKREDWYYKVWQSFAVLLPVQTVGVMGDERTYESVVALRIVESIDGMTADWTRLPYDILARISNRIINEVRGVNRVCYDISSKPPGTIEWE